MSQIKAFCKYISRNRVLTMTALLGVALGIGLTAYASLRFAMWTPYADHWTLVAAPLLRAQEVGWLMALWEQDNDSRMPVARALYLICLKLSGWRLWVENLATLLLAALTATGFVRVVMRTGGEFERGWQLLAGLGVLLIFGLQQSLTWQFGVVSAYALVVVSMIGVVLLTRDCTWPRLVAACGLAGVGTLSFANGWVLWPLIGLALLRPDAAGWAGLWRRWPQMVMLGIVFGGFTMLYFNGYVFKSAAEAGEPMLERLLHQPSVSARFFVCLIGSMTADVWPVMDREIRFQSVWWTGLGFGVVYLLAWLLALWGLLRQWRTQDWHRVWPFLQMSLFGLGSAVLVTLARAGHPAGNPFEPRYITFVLWLPLGTLGMLWVGLAQSGRMRGVAGVLAVLMLGGWLGGSVIGWRRMEADYYAGRLQSAAMLLRKVAPEPDLMIYNGGASNRDVLQPTWLAFIDRIEEAGCLRPPAVTKSVVGEAQVERLAALDRGRILEVKRQGSEGLWVKAQALAPERAGLADALVLTAEAPDGVERWLGVAQKRTKFSATARKMGVTAFEGRIGFEYRTPASMPPESGFNPILPPATAFLLRAYVLDVATGRFWQVGDLERVAAAE